MTTSSSHLEILSVELRQTILSKIPDILSLRSAALSCPALYNAFLNAETLITTRVLLNQVDFGVLPEAIITQDALRFKPCAETHIQEFTAQELTAKSLHDFIARHLRERRSPPKSWKLCDAIRIGKLHACVSELALQFVAIAATKSPSCGFKPAMRAEICRIERALYRFEIFCNLFRGFDGSDSGLLERLWDKFFSNFSPWENEQLACVHDYLVQVVYPAFNDIAEHDIACGEFRVEYDGDRDSVFIQYLLSLGLERLQRISVAETYEARYELLYSGYYLNFKSNFLYEALNRANGVDNTIYLSELTSTDERTHIRSPFFNDPDSGPADIWRWAHQDETMATFVNQDNRTILREWGYVMWNRARLDHSYIFQRPWERPQYDEERSRADTQRHGEMMMSWDARSKIYMMGGRGWWSVGDHSKIIWPSGKPPWKTGFAPALTTPDSLEEARNAFRLMKLPEGLDNRKRG